MVQFTKTALWRISPRILDLVAPAHRGQTFSIGIYTGDSPLALVDPAEVNNPVLTRKQVTDVPAAFVADPFMMQRDGHWYMFMEVFNRLNYRGEIGVATSEDGLNWQYQRVVLREPFHLAYPCVLSCEDQTYMIPDTPGRGARLYRASGFPYRWEFVRELLSDPCLCDSTVFRHHERWWMLTGWIPQPGESVSLRLFSADALAGDWQEHPASPLLTRCVERARPAGPIIDVGSRIFRLAQDGTPYYGSRVRAFEILELTETTYREAPVEANIVVQSGDRHWNSGGMHHVHAHAADGRWIACVDGWYPADSDAGA
ncbi:MAG: hypothetical protein ACNA7W_13985 [Pseudomonadales bacterium]